MANLNYGSDETGAVVVYRDARLCGLSKTIPYLIETPE
jgi:hypothetical protein